MSANNTNTANLTMHPVTKGGFPNIVNDAFDQAINSALVGGDALQSYYDSMNQTTDFWGYMAANSGQGQNPFAPGTDPNGNPIVMSSSGNVDMRIGAFYHGDTPAALGAGPDDPPVVGIATIQTGNTTSNTSKTISFAVSIAGLPPGLILGKKLFADLIKPIYSNMKTWITKNAKNVEESSQVEDPDIDPESEADDALSDASGELEDVGGQLAEEGVEYAAIEWGSVGLEVAGMAALAALPMIISFLGHKMVASVSIINRTNFDFAWDIAYQDSGKTSVSPKTDTGKIIPKLDYYTDMWGDKTTIKAAYEGNFQFINSSDLGSIGSLLTLTPQGGGAASVANLVISIPWTGTNTIWVGNSTGDAESTYLQNSLPNNQLSMTETFDAYSVTISITKLSGETKGQYFYGVLAVIDPKS